MVRMKEKAGDWPLNHTLKAVRREEGVTTRALSRLVGVSQPAITYFEIMRLRLRAPLFWKMMVALRRPEKLRDARCHECGQPLSGMEVSDVFTGPGKE